jgi:glucokinase
MNDFEAIGYGINLLKKKDFLIINKKISNKIKNQTKAVIGAGTGLGKAILNYDECFNCYVPIASEGGHADFPVYDLEELKLINFIKKIKKINQVSWEDLLSGKGLESIYFYLKKNKKSAEEISKHRKTDKTYKKTFELFTRFYARAVKNFTLETLALGGVYIAGGIAAKNSDIFKSQTFLKEYKNNYKLKNVLVNIPVYVILNQNIGLYGSAFAAIYRKDLALKG